MDLYTNHFSVTMRTKKYIFFIKVYLRAKVVYMCFLKNIIVIIYDVSLFIIIFLINIEIFLSQKKNLALLTLSIN